ncbi:MAG: hypothetical protein GY849_02395 [Deltaproteobacteria bacterium]|nr:hypothetical protein [Deltaproteobacteria bacterium]
MIFVWKKIFQAKIMKRQLNMIFHKSIETLPIFQYYKLFDSKDYRYLLFLERKDLLNLPEIEDKKLLEENFNQFFKKLENIKDETQHHKIKILKGFSKYIEDKSSMEYNLAFVEYLKYLAKQNLIFFEDGIEFDDVFKFYKYLKKKHSDFDIKRIEIFFNLEIKQENKNNFFKQIANIQKQGYPINVYENSFAYYLGIIKDIEDARKRLSEKTEKIR